jgi:hypothetical protein
MGSRLRLLLPTLRRVTPDGKLRPLDPTDLGDLAWLEERLAAKGERKRAARCWPGPDPVWPDPVWPEGRFTPTLG